MNCPLVPIDGSENSLRALAHAMAELRDRSGTQFCGRCVEAAIAVAERDSSVAETLVAAS